jgi:phosphoglycerate dehydrogenase-like enzyme
MSTRPKPRVLLVYPLLDATVDAELHSDSTLDVIDAAGDAFDDLRRGLVGADAVIMRGPARLTAALIDRADGLRVIGELGSGTDNIDVAAATARGIRVVNGTGVAADSVAEFVLGAMVTAHRGFLLLHGRYKGRELTGTTLGVVGYGQIGRLVARKARAAFETDVIAYDPFLLERPVDDGVRFAEHLVDLLASSDTVTIHVPRTAETVGLIGAAELEAMRVDAVLVDAARGGIVDEDALIAALRNGRLRGAVVDVFSEEPPSPELVAKLASTPRLLVTPHIAGVTSRAGELLSRNVVKQVKAVLTGSEPSRIANPEVYAP